MIIVVLKRMGLRAPDLRPKTVRSFLREQGEESRIPAEQQEFNLRHWRGMAASFAQENLTLLAGSPLALVQPSLGWNLCRDVAGILLWDMHEYMLGESKRWSKVALLDTKQKRFAAAAAFEQRSSRLVRLLNGFWWRFLAWLNMEEPWRRPLNI